MWFNEDDIPTHKLIKDTRLHGYVLPHASTKYCGHIIGHTLRFVPAKKITNVIVLYYPSGTEFDVNDRFYHELYVPAMSIQYMIHKVWKLKYKIKYRAINVRDSKADISKYQLSDTIFIISADFTHFLPLQEAINVENCAATSLSFKDFDQPCLKYIDTLKTFMYLNSYQPLLNFDWIGRTRSAGLKGVGYLTFLIHSPLTNIKTPHGFFVTIYDENMRARECLGKWSWSKAEEKSLIAVSAELAATTSRLTGGKFLYVPPSWYTITYLYETKDKHIIRGVHGILKEAFYLPTVFLEHVYDNGVWMTDDDKEWPQGVVFDMTQTLEMLKRKSGSTIDTKEFKLYVALYTYHKL